MPTKAEEAKKADKAAEWTECDVAILGSGLAGSIMGAILARQGANVVLIDAGQHPGSPSASPRTRSSSSGCTFWPCATTCPRSSTCWT